MDVSSILYSKGWDKDNVYVRTHKVIQGNSKLTAADVNLGTKCQRLIEV